MLVKIEDARALKFCSKAMRDFFKRHNLDYIDFAKNGIDSEVLLSTNDVMAKRVVDRAMERENNG